MKTAKKTIFYFSLVAGTLLILVTLLSLIYNVGLWYLKVLDFPRVQVLLGLLLLLLLFVASNHRWKLPSVLFLAGLLASIALQAYFILPYTPLVGTTVASVAPAAVEKDRRFSLLLANVWMKNRQVETLLSIIQQSDPDIVLVMETDKWWIARLAPLRKEYPYQVEYPLDNTYGMALYSRMPLESTQVRFLAHQTVPSIHTKVILDAGAVFTLHAMHPVPPKPSKYPDNVGDGENEVALLKVGKMVQQRQTPTIVAGDFNDVSWSNTSRLFGVKSRLGNVRIGRGLYNSFDATSNILRWPLDQIFVSEEFRLVELRRLPDFGSDHFPFYAELALPE
ncbi:endonuclease/exonuclease/phosphatase family protein [Pontibacter actiniarum]|uniref:Endonuclease n=1 Tax=Pontibacter actiniarum TaxID=323450 RepID=A0A1X9YPB6_9BACT|nr:endonuclease/exonuclease/phosphatase family protein [Pontibacter actiniarum]ARS34746.1 endonuclease [Pontibacter actiniarum]